MRILILGASGLLGSAMRRVWTKHELLTPAEESLNITDVSSVGRTLDELRPDWVVNCAAYNNVDGAESTGREVAYALNAEAPTMLAELTAKRRIPLIHFSSDYVFGGDGSKPYTESDTPEPRSVYAESKRQGELGVLKQPNTYLIRTSRLYGPKPDLPTAKRSFVELILADAEKAAQILVNGGEISSPTYVDDLARHIEAHILDTRPEPGIYHMTNQGGASWYDWAVEIGRTMDIPTAFKPRDPSTLKRPATRPAYSVLASTKKPAMRSWQEALQDFLKIHKLPFQQKWVATGITGCAVELQPRIGDADGAVLHMLPGGIKNAEGFGSDLLDIYSFTAKGMERARGGHYHLKLDELFFQMSGTALWLLSDFRDGSLTKGKTVGLVLGTDRPATNPPLPAYFQSDGSLPRLRVPAGIYHAIYPLTQERVTCVGLGSTPYDKEDYRYPIDIPDAETIMRQAGIEIPPR